MWYPYIGSGYGTGEILLAILSYNILLFFPLSKYCTPFAITVVVGCRIILVESSYLNGKTYVCICEHRYQLKLYLIFKYSYTVAETVTIITIEWRDVDVNKPYFIGRENIPSIRHAMCFILWHCGRNWLKGKGGCGGFFTWCWRLILSTWIGLAPSPPCHTGVHRCHTGILFSMVNVGDVLNGLETCTWNKIADLDWKHKSKKA